MESRANDFDSWDKCDGCCNKLFRKTRFAYQEARGWTGRPAEFLSIVARESVDDRNFVRKGARLVVEADWEAEYPPQRLCHYGHENRGLKVLECQVDLRRCAPWAQA